MAEEETVMKQTKSMLRAVLLSAPRGVIARRLQAEYRSITGSPIPYQKLGYYSLEDFLRSIPDVIHASAGATGELTFFGVADSSTEHIAKLVSKQKKPKLSRARISSPRSFTPKQNKFFGHHRSPMNHGGLSFSFDDRGPRRPPVMSPSVRTVSVAPPVTRGMLLSANGIGKCREDVSKARPVPIKGLSSQVTLPKNRMLKVQGYVSGGPQLRTRRGQQRYGTVLIRDSLPKGFAILCLFSAPQWDAEKNTDFHTYMLDGDAVEVFAYPDVINTPKYYNGKSVALQVVAVWVNNKNSSPMRSQPQDLRTNLPPKRAFQDNPNDLRHTLSGSAAQEEATDLRHVIRQKQNAQDDLRMVINNSRQQQQQQQQVGVREVMLSDVTSPTTTTAPPLQSSPLKGADAQLEREVCEIVQTCSAGMLWKRVEVLYKNKFNRELSSRALDLVGRMRGVTVEELACGLTVYPVTPPPTPPPPTPLHLAPHTPTASSVASTSSDGFIDTLPAQIPLKVGETVLFVITNVRSPSCFYGYKRDDNDRVDELIRQVHSLYQDTPSPVPEVGVVPGRTYVAQFSEDRIWYRARVESVNEYKGIYTVFYLDFGNEEEVPRERLRPLSAKLSSLPPFAVQLALSLADATPDQGMAWSTEATSKFSALVLDKEVCTVITSCIRDASGYRYEVQAKELVADLVEAGIANTPKPLLPVEVSHPPLTPEADAVKDSKQSPPPIPSVVELPDKFFECYLSHLLSPASFYIQRIGPQYHEQLEALEQDMTAHFARNRPVPVKEPREDSLVALRSVEEDGSTYWYRAKVLTELPQESKVELELVDYGNTDVVDLKDVMLLPSKFYHLSFQAVHCCLRGLSDFLESPKIYDTFMEYRLQEKALTAKVVTSPGTRITLELIDQENIEKGSINVQLMSLGTPISLLSPVLPNVGERVSVNVTDLNAEGVVSIQLHGPSLPHLDDLMKLINTQYNQKSTATSFVQDVSEGMLCCAKHNSEWYRVKVLEVEENGVRVEYTDSGKTATLARRDLRKQLEDRLFALPPQAVKCRLADLPPPDGEWKETAVSAFWDATGDCLSDIEVVSSSSGDLPLVRMWCKVEDGEEQDVSALLRAQPEAFGLPPVPQEPTSDRTDPYEDFTFETDTTGEEDEAEGSGSRSESDPAPDSSKGESPKSSKSAAETPTAQPVPPTSGDASGDAINDDVSQANKVELFHVAEVEESFECHPAPPELVKETFVPAYVSNVSSPTDFWLAPCTLDKEYKRFQLALEAYCSCASSVEPTTLMEDTVFSVKKDAAGEWFRARRVDQTQAFLVDVGSLLVLSGLVCVQLPPALSQVPPLAVRCSLCGLKPDSAGHWSKSAVAKFSELVERQNICVLAVGIQKDGEQRRHLVELVDTSTTNGNDFIISDQLLEMCLAVSTLSLSSPPH